MSTLKVDTYLTRGGASEIAIDKLKGVTAAGSMLVVGEGGTNTTNLQQGLAKSWVNFNGSTFGTRDSYNIGSVTDVSAGTYVPNFTSGMSNANYTITLVCGDNMHNTTLHNTETATGSYRIHNLNDGGSFADTSIIMTNVHGDLA